MNTPNKVLMEKARETLKGKWWVAIQATLLYLIIQILLGAVPGKLAKPIVSLAVGAPIALGLTMFWLSFSRNDATKITKIFEGFNTWVRALKTYFLMSLYILLWTLLLIIPGIIASFAYSQTFYIISEDKEIGTRAALKKSKEMMKGNKWKLFCLLCGFIGWGLLSIISFGIGFIWLIPYVQVTLAKFYDDIKSGEVKHSETPELASIPTAN